jgi:small subunit ribosomal protein S1
LKAKILDIDLEKERISLGIKQLTSNPVADAAEKVRKGDAVTCIITAVTEQGLEVSVGNTLSGFIRRR